MISYATRDLATRLADLLAREHGALADFVLALAAFDREGRWKEYGYTSLFDFLHRELRLSTGTAYYRQTAARLVQRFPEVAEALRDGRLCVTAIVELSKVLNERNRAEVLPRFFHASKQQAKVVAAELNPRQDPPVRTMVTATPASPALATIDRGLPLRAGTAAFQPVEAHAPLPEPEPPRTETEPLNREQARLHATVDRTMLAELEELKSLLSHRMPGATTEQLLALAVHELLVEERRKKALVEKPRPAPPPRAAPEPGCRDARHIPAAVEREVRLRDQGQCQFRLENGELCGSTHQVELHHLKPHADGGTANADDLSLRCRKHHALETERQFGDGLVSQCRLRRRLRPRERHREQPALL